MFPLTEINKVIVNPSQLFGLFDTGCTVTMRGIKICATVFVLCLLHEVRIDSIFKMIFYRNRNLNSYIYILSIHPIIMLNSEKNHSKYHISTDKKNIQNVLFHIWPEVGTNQSSESTERKVYCRIHVILIRV